MDLKILIHQHQLLIPIQSFHPLTELKLNNTKKVSQFASLTLLFSQSIAFRSVTTQHANSVLQIFPQIFNSVHVSEIKIFLKNKRLHKIKYSK